MKGDIRIESYVDGEWRIRNQLTGLNLANMPFDQKMDVAAAMMHDWQRNYSDNARLRITVTGDKQWH